MVHGLPQKPQGAAGPSRPPTQQQSSRQRQPIQPQYQQPNHYPYAHPQAQVPAGGYHPYTAQPTAPYNPYAAYYQQAAQSYPYGYGYQPTMTPEGYSYSATYQNQATPAYNEPPNKRSRPNSDNIASSSASVISVKPWRNCSHPGCKFVGSGEDVEVHEGDRHLIFPNGRPVERSEEEEKWASHKGPPPPIEGTGIVLASDEDIAKWIAERKAKWPSAKRLAERNEEREAAIARGENPDRGRGRGRGGANGGKRNNPAAAAEDWGRSAPAEGSGQSTRGTGRGRGQDRGRGRGRGRGGTSGGTTQDRGYAGRQAHQSAEASVGASTTKLEEISKGPQPETPVVPEVKLDAGLVGSNLDAIVGEEDNGSQSDSSSDSSWDDDDDEQDFAKPKPANEARPKAPTPICRFFAKTGRCKMGQKCKFLHPDNVKPQDISRNTRPSGSKQQQAKKTNPFERPSMLGALLANPIQNTLSQLTQTIRFLVANDMLRGVELNPGDADEQQKERTKISMVDGDGMTGAVDEVSELEA